MPLHDVAPARSTIKKRKMKKKGNQPVQMVKIQFLVVRVTVAKERETTW